MKEALGISLKFRKIFEEMILKDLGHSFFLLEVGSWDKFGFF